MDSGIGLPVPQIERHVSECRSLAKLRLLSADRCWEPDIPAPICGRALRGDVGGLDLLAVAELFVPAVDRVELVG